jgi:hypothetical protein
VCKYSAQLKIVVSVFINLRRKHFSLVQRTQTSFSLVLSTSANEVTEILSDVCYKICG